MAVDVGGTSIKGGLVTSDGTILYSERRPTPRAEGPDRVIAAISSFIADLSRPRPHAAGLLTPVAVGLAVPGLVTPTHAIFSAAFGWRDVPAEAFSGGDLPLALGHDVRSAGEAELAFAGAAEREAEGAGREREGDQPEGGGAGRECEGGGHVLYLPIGTGIAGAIVLSGSLYGGASGWAGQIGHIPVWPDGLPCGCGQRGCLGAYASASAIASRCGESSAAAVVRRVEAGDTQATSVWDEAVEALAAALATYTLLLDPALVVVGGGLSLAGDTLLVPLRERLASRLAFRHPPGVRASSLGVHAGLLGAGLLAARAR
ncbi:ROK family protein [Nonomuraea sp. NPDC000554]|uniref:ROK family protein n=1 Tax=Nonomuraea sp. NPDC000554 TaxID=3154259 RepID=UPI00331CE3F7